MQKKMRKDWPRAPDTKVISPVTSCSCAHLIYYSPQLTQECIEYVPLHSNIASCCYQFTEICNIASSFSMLQEVFLILLLHWGPLDHTSNSIGDIVEDISSRAWIVAQKSNRDPENPLPDIDWQGHMFV